MRYSGGGTSGTDPPVVGNQRRRSTHGAISNPKSKHDNAFLLRTRSLHLNLKKDNEIFGARFAACARRLLP
jgi:hypothetical protein